MNKNEYQKLVKKNMPKEKLLKNLIITFIVGGIMGIIGQGLIDIYSYFLHLSFSSASIYMIVTLIIIASVLTGFGVFDTLVEKAKFGLIIPITGFAHSMTSSAMEYKKEGLILGIGSNIFKLTGSVILYGVVSAYIFSILRILFFGGL